ncbi:MAG: hypothetical protein JWO36_3066 [Myxococcales bacterium]|nr:hypothetical protein [Myxococcales bacterium]
MITTRSTDALFAAYVDARGSGSITTLPPWTTQDTNAVFFYTFADNLNDNGGSLAGTYQGTATSTLTQSSWVGLIAAFVLE